MGSQPPPQPNFDPEATHDIEIGKIFTNMRLAQKVSRETIARRLATSIFTVEAFETGALASLPHWREAERIVRGYCELLHLDPQPILWRLQIHYHPSGLPMGLLNTPSGTPSPVQGQAGPRQAQDQIPASLRSGPSSRTPSPRRRRRRRRVFLALTAPVLAVVGALLAAQSAPGALYAGAAFLPQPLAYPVRAGVDALVQTMAPVRDGMRWVDIGDPQLRKSDKLHTRR